MTYRKILFLLAVCSALVGCGGGNWSTGDRVLVDKCIYDTGLMEPRRFDVVVFKYPQGPMDKNTPKNYIKRLWGLPGELIAIFFGNLYRYVPPPGTAPPYDDSQDDPNKLWQVTHANEDRGRDLFKAGKFEILRKPPEVMLALRRIVYDNDYHAKDLVGKVPARWSPAASSGWKAELAGTAFVHAGAAGEQVDWLRYQHLVRPDGPIVGGMAVRPRLITDVMGYNSFQVNLGTDRDPIPQDRTPAQHWVGDLMLECQVDVVEPKGELFVELSKGPSRFQARWDLPSGVCTLFKVGPGGKKEELASQPTRVKGPGSYQLRLANFDARLTVWVDRDLPFEDGAAYRPAEAPDPETAEQLKQNGPTENDLEPASVGSKGAHVKVAHVRLWRDTYYTTSARDPDYPAGDMPADAWADPDRWGPLHRQRFSTLYVQPGHYLCLGDNSEASSDSRDWGLVPARLMLGRALVVYYPFNRAGPIR